MASSSASTEEALQIMRASGALLQGHFILRSGLHSGHFFQCARVGEHMDHITRLAELLIAELPTRAFDTVLAPAMGGLVLGQEVARQTGARYLFAEKVDDHLELRRNFQFKPGEKVLIVEDVITRGGRVQEAIDIVHCRNAEVVGIAVLVDRSAGKAKFAAPLTPLVEMVFPTYAPDAIPEELRDIPAIKPGS